jgi:hypothetical protein
MSPDLHTVVSWVLDEGHLNTELLARLRAAWEAEHGPRTEDPAIHYCHRFAILMECVMLGGVDKYWDEMGTLLDEYHKARDAWMTAHGQPYVSGFGKD